MWSPALPFALPCSFAHHKQQKCSQENHSQPFRHNIVADDTCTQGIADQLNTYAPIHDTKVQSARTFVDITTLWYLLDWVQERGGRDKICKQH